MDSKVPLAECQTQPDNGKAVGSNPTRHHSLETAQRETLELRNRNSDIGDVSVMPLLHAQLTREFELAHSTLEQRLHMLRRTLSGLATNATNCKACRMRVEIIEHALRRDDTGGVCQEANCWCVR